MHKISCTTLKITKNYNQCNENMKSHTIIAVQNLYQTTEYALSYLDIGFLGQLSSASQAIGGLNIAIEQPVGTLLCVSLLL